MKLRDLICSKLLLVISLVLVLPACTTATKNFQPGAIPPFQALDQSEAESARQLLNRIANENELELSQEGPFYERVKSIVNRLSPAGKVTQEIVVYTSDAGDLVNAFAMGGNTIVVYDELVRRLPKDEELAVIISHEMAHLLGGHNKDRTVEKRGSAVSILSSVLGTAVSVATGSDLAGDLLEVGSAAVGTGVVLSYGRAMEHEADHIGMLLMAKSDYDPRVALDVWSRADEILGKGGRAAFLSSHPSHGNRRKRLEEDLVYAIRVSSGDATSADEPLN